MAKAIERDGKLYRIRRGKEVEIPAQWVGKFPTKSTMRKRPSQMTGKMRRKAKRRGLGLSYLQARESVLDAEA